MHIRNAMIVALASFALSLLFIAPASAAWFTIDDSNPLTVTISAGQFEGGFYVDGQLLTSGYDSGSITLPDSVHDFSGSWITYGAPAGNTEILFARAGNPTIVTSGLMASWENSDVIFSYLEGGFGCYVGPGYFTTGNTTVLQDGHTEYSSAPYMGITFVSENPVPIPSALLLFAPGLAGLAALRRRFRK
ncbi:MAG: VPLPA-CTERM sorting domain-containing protein [Proteobacteria bacterium]|nr:VPLPA-CTERM sorting domain-containing protein [Pseudomonadota bacterium]